MGSPGIGKSWTLLYALQQALLYDGASVMLFLKKMGRAFLFLRRGIQIFAWQANSQKDVEADSILFSRKDLLVLLDPRESKDGGANYTNNSRMLIFAASNNEAHFTNDIVKKRGDAAMRHLDAPTTEELIVSIPKMGTEYNLESALERAKVVGRLPRYLMDDELYDTRLRQTNECIASLGHDTAEMKKILQFHGLVEEKNTLPRTIYSVGATFFSETNEDDDDDATQDDGATQGGDAGNATQQVEEPSGGEDTSEADDVGYDGQFGVDYKTRKLSIMSTYVLEELVTKERSNILSFWAKVGGGQLSGMGMSVEDLFWRDLKDVNGFRMRTFKMEPGNGAGQQGELLNQPPSNSLEGVSLENLTPEMVAHGTVCRMVEGCALIDNAGPGYQVYQLPVSGDHSMSMMGLESLLVNFGYLEKDNDTVKIAKHPPSNKLKYYWVVPHGMESKWKTKSPKGYRYTDGNKRKRKESTAERKRVNALKKVLRDCLKQHVEQIVLVMEEQLRPAAGETP